MNRDTARQGPVVRARLRVEGTVQGVGFRPFVYRIAHEEDLAGYVLNDDHGVLVEVEGRRAAVERFVGRMRADTPPLATVDRMVCDSRPLSGERGFQIRESPRLDVADALVAPDTGTCADCLVELLDPGDRRHRYPFINCTNCGPRLTIVRGVPYDRALTTMAGFAMCEECRREYDDPLDRRFHAQPNACPRCGPHVQILDQSGVSVATHGSSDPIAWIARRIAGGAIVAVKGLGGFHLVCDGADERVVAKLRSRKHREDKPFALMVSGLKAAHELVRLGREEEALLESVQRPVVLAPRRAGARVAAAVAPRAAELGVMLPYTPLHHLLLGDFKAAVGDGANTALVMTSGNVSDEPIAYRDEDALERLSGIADLFLLHDREIETRVDDSVVRVVSTPSGRQQLPLRRSRGYVPGPLALTNSAPRALLACGAEQKNTFCVAKGSRAWVSHHIGDLEHYPTLRAYREGIEHFERLFGVSPELVAHDLHPNYLSTAYALEREGVMPVGVQHHHAHLAACLTESGLEGPVVSAIFDGTGYGLDGTVWGGELLVGGLASVDRAGWLWPVRMPGAAAAIRQPWRMAFAWLAEAFGHPQPLPARLRGQVDPGRWAAMGQIWTSDTVSPLTSSVGRLFDAVGAMCGLGVEVSYEGQAAVELETAAWTTSAMDAYKMEVLETSCGLVLDPRSAIRRIAEELERGVDTQAVAARFHAGLADATVAALVSIATARGLDTAVLNGGVFQNRLLLEMVSASLERAGVRMLIPHRLPCNDGGISFGQVAVVAARDRAGLAVS